MHRSITVKKELSRKAKLSIYWFIYVLTLNYSHELWVMAKLLPRDRLRRSVPWEELGVKPLFLHIERSQLRWLGHLFRMPLDVPSMSRHMLERLDGWMDKNH